MSRYWSLLEYIYFHITFSNRKIILILYSAIFLYIRSPYLLWVWWSCTCRFSICSCSSSFDRCTLRYRLAWLSACKTMYRTLIAVNCECKYFLGLKFCIIYNLFLYPEWVNRPHPLQLRGLSLTPRPEPSVF